jgi:DNA-binding PadR family transcriptional regulator
MANLIIQPLSLPEIYVVAVMLESNEADLDGLSIASEVLTCCAQLISVSAVYRVLDRLERQHVVTWEQSGEGSATPVRSRRRYRVTIDGQNIFAQSLGFVPIEERGKIAHKTRKFQVVRRGLFGPNENEDI